MRDTSKQAAAITKALASDQNIANLAQRVIDLQTPDKLTIAAALLIAGKVELAEAVATRAVQEIQLAQLFGRTKAEGK